MVNGAWQARGFIVVCERGRRWGGVVAPLVLALFALPLPMVAAAGKTLIYCSEGSPEHFGPALSTSITTWDASSRPVFDRLIDRVRGTTELQPGLAESFEISDDGRTYRFRLRDGVRFHATEGFAPTRDLNADDVLFSVRRQLDPDHPYHLVGGGTYPVFDALGFGELIEDVRRVDDRTIEFTLSRPNAPFLASLAMDFMSITSAEYAAHLASTGREDEIDRQPVGTGPFVLEHYQEDNVIRYRANPDYWQGAPPIDALLFSITPDASVRLAKLKSGECHVMPFPNPADTAGLAADSEVELLSQPGLNISYLAFNTKKPPFDDVRVRRALSLAIDREAILQAVYLGAAEIAASPIPPGLFAHDDTLAAPPHDAAEAKRLLDEAGYGQGFTTDLWAMPVQRAYNPNARRMAELIQADWARVGVRVEIVSYEWGEYLRRSKAGEHLTILLGWTAQNADPDNILSVNLSCDSVESVNRARWCDPAFDALLDQARAITELQTREGLYHEAQALLAEEVPWATLAHAEIFEAIRPEVIDYRIDPFGGHVFYGVGLED